MLLRAPASLGRGCAAPGTCPDVGRSRPREGCSVAARAGANGSVAGLYVNGASNGARNGSGNGAAAAVTVTLPRDPVAELMEHVANGRVRPGDAAAQVSDFVLENRKPTDAVSEMVDSFRADRTGFPEVIWGANKSPLQIVTILRKLAESDDVAVATRVDQQVADEVRAMMPGPQLQYFETARMLVLRGSGKRHQPRLAGAVAVVTAGTGDAAVAEECRRTAELMGCYVFRLQDVGIDNGLHRVVQNLPAVRAADVIIVVAGMDGSLPSVIAGLVDSPVIAVPTSVGYGAAFGGVSPLLSALTAGAPGVATVNIDNGFGAAMLAARMLRTAAKIRAKIDSSHRVEALAGQPGRLS